MIEWQEFAGGSVRLECGNCFEVIGEEEIDAIVSDPPYGMNWDTGKKKFRSKGKVTTRPEYKPIIGDRQPFDPSPWLKYPRVVLWGFNHYASRLPVGTTLVWLKRTDKGFGSFLSDAEIAWMKGGHGVYVHRKVFPGPSRKKEAGFKHSVHPTQKPLSLMSWCIQKCKTPAGGLVCDPYMGSGTTGVAAVQGGFDFLGIEMDAEYFDIACQRIEAALAGDAPLAKAA